jgi:DNA polymerase-3 subunit gamma/tau
MSQALYRTWRPSSWDEVAGQEHIVQTLRNAVVSNRVNQAYLFAGPRGTGKTTSARLLAKAVNCLAENPADRPCNVCENCKAVNQGRFLDLIEIDAASNTSVDDVRELRDTINFAPSQGKFKVYIIDEVHMLSTSAFNALLKTLEEPPSHVIFILATTEIHKIPATVLSRCQRHEFRRIPLNQIVEKLRLICAQESIQIDEDALSLIARQSTGSMRDAISLVDQLVDYLRSLLVVKLSGGKDLELLPEVRSTVNKQAAAFSAAELIAGINEFSKAAAELKANWHPGLGLELAFAKSVSQSEASVAMPALVPEKNVRVTPKTHEQSKPAPEPPKERQPEGKAAEASPDAEAPAEPAPRTNGELNLENLLLDWDKIKREVRGVDQVASALLNSSRIIRVENNIITLGFKSDLLRDKMNEEKPLKVVRGVLAKFYPEEVLIVCTAGTQAVEEHPDIVPNGLVDMTLRELGGRVRKKTVNNEKKE